ncbi:MAG: arsenate reductase (azurin) small subunit [Hyphomicrobium sp.]|nr:arsenate reductase (azurin) small subunit [Hyphomicrobium sp.]
MQALVANLLKAYAVDLQTLDWMTPETRQKALDKLHKFTPYIAYPDKSSPGVLIKLGTRVPGGVGPAGDIVAFSTLCPHKGFPLSYVAGEKTLTCPGHYSVFDCEKGGLQVMGQATQNLPQFMLRVAANGDIFAEGVDELIYGRLSNVL